MAIFLWKFFEKNSDFLKIYFIYVQCSSMNINNANYKDYVFRNVNPWLALFAVQYNVVYGFKNFINLKNNY